MGISHGNRQADLSHQGQVRYIIADEGRAAGTDSGVCNDFIEQLRLVLHAVIYIANAKVMAAAIEGCRFSAGHQADLDPRPHNQLQT